MLIDEKVIMLENQDKYLKRAFELSLEYPIPLHGTLYIAQAEKPRTRLLTSGKVQAYAAQSIGLEAVYIP